MTTETEVACIERDEQAGLADLGLQLAEAKQLTAALQAGSCRRRWLLLGEHPPLMRRVRARAGQQGPLRGDVPLPVRRRAGAGPAAARLSLPGDEGEAKSFAVLDFGGDAVAPELAYVTARYAALMPFGKVADLLSELLPVSGAQNAGTVRNRTLRVGEDVVPPVSGETAKPPDAAGGGSCRGWAGWRLCPQPAPTGGAPF